MAGDAQHHFTLERAHMSVNVELHVKNGRSIGREPAFESEWARMSWLTRYRIKRYARSSVWIVPATYFFVAALIARATYELERATDWTFFGVTMAGATAALSAAAASTLS